MENSQTFELKKNIPLMAVLLSGAFITILNQTLLATALPPIMKDLQCYRKYSSVAAVDFHARQRNHDSNHGIFNRKIYNTEIIHYSYEYIRLWDINCCSFS